MSGYISIQSVYDLIDKGYLVSNHNPKKIRKLISELPSADVRENVRGEWIDTSEGTYCSRCNKFPYDDGEYRLVGWRSNFCPNCGADMRGEKE